MKQLALFLGLLLSIAMFTACADSKEFTDSAGQTFTAEPYGWANADAQKIDTVVYQVSVGNVVWSVIGIETIIIPIWLTGWELYEPVRLKTPSDLAGKYKPT